MAKQSDTFKGKYQTAGKANLDATSKNFLTKKVTTVPTGGTNLFPVSSGFLKPRQVEAIRQSPKGQLPSFIARGMKKK